MANLGRGLLQFFLAKNALLGHLYDLQLLCESILRLCLSCWFLQVLEEFQIDTGELEVGDVLLQAALGFQRRQVRRQIQQGLVLCAGQAKFAPITKGFQTMQAALLRWRACVKRNGFWGF